MKSTEKQIRFAEFLAAKKGYRCAECALQKMLGISGTAARREMGRMQIMSDLIDWLKAK